MLHQQIKTTEGSGRQSLNPGEKVLDGFELWTLFKMKQGVKQLYKNNNNLKKIYFKKSRHSQGEEVFWFGDPRIASLLFADDVLLVASSGEDL